MGILNVTPDSFYDGGINNTIEKATSQAIKMIDEGAKIIDIGGYSTRPGANEISIEEELNRVIPVIISIKKIHPNCIISVDTFRRKVAEKSIDSGADIINDISGGELDNTMFDFIIESKTPYIIMHSKGNPKTMKNETNYTHLINDILDYFNNKVIHLKSNGVSDIILDPGFGFAKTLEQNFELLKNINVFNQLDLPLLIGISRKSMIYNELNIESKDALTGTIALNMFSLQQGAKILRVHDVKEAVQTIKLFNKIKTY